MYNDIQPSYATTTSANQDHGRPLISFIRNEIKTKRGPKALPVLVS